jgi:hypothetical protein
MKDMAGAVIEWDFGKKDREAVRSFARLMNLVESHDREILADPIKYITMCGVEVERLTGLIESMKAALRPNMATILSQVELACPELPETIRVTKSEYDRWQAAKAILYAPDPSPAKPSEAGQVSVIADES